MVSTLTRLEESNNLTEIKVVYKENVRMGSSVGDRWMVYGKNASQYSSWSLLTHATRKNIAVSKARDIAKGYKPSKLYIEDKSGTKITSHEYE